MTDTKSLEDYSNDLNFIFSEISNWNLNFEKLKDAPANQRLVEDIGIFCSLGRSKKRGELFMGRKAEERLSKLCKKILHQYRETNSISAHTFKRIFSQTFIDKAVDPDQTPQGNFDGCLVEIINESLRSARGLKTDSTHFFPVNLRLEDAPDCIEFGPFSIQKMLHFQRRNPDMFSETRIKGEHDFLGLADKYFSKFDTILEVSLKARESDFADDLAEKTALAALDCLHLLIGGTYTTDLKLAGSPPSPIDQSRLKRDSNQVLQASQMLQFTSNVVLENWWKGHSNTWGQTDPIPLMGEAIDRSVVQGLPNPSARRFLDAAAWYRDGVVDRYAPSKIIKFATAVEHIVCAGIGSSSDGPTKRFAKRAKALIQILGIENNDNLNFDFKEFYDNRSDLVHGRKSNSIQNWEAAAVRAESHARWALLGGLVFYSTNNGFHQEVGTNVTFEQAFDTLVKWSIDGAMKPD